MDFCIVSADWFQSLLDIHIKRDAELPTGHHLVVCKLQPTGPTQMCGTKRTSWIKWETRMEEIPLQTVYHPCFKRPQSA